MTGFSVWFTRNPFLPCTPCLIQNKTATGERYANINVEKIDDQWSLVGCEASIPGSCFATKRVVLKQSQITELTNLVNALIEHTPKNDCCKKVQKVEPYKLHDYTLSYGQDSYRGSIKDPEKAACPATKMALWILKSFGS